MIFAASSIDLKTRRSFLIENKDLPKSRCFFSAIIFFDEFVCDSYNYKLKIHGEYINFVSILHVYGEEGGFNILYSYV